MFISVVSLSANSFQPTLYVMETNLYAIETIHRF